MGLGELTFYVVQFSGAGSMLQIGVAPADDAQSNFHLLTMTRRDWTLVGHLHS